MTGLILAATTDTPPTTSTSSPWLLVILALMSAGALNVAFEAYKYIRGGQRRKDRAEAADASMKVATDLQQAPMVRDALALGNFDKALAMQQQVINGLNAQLERDRKANDLAIADREREIRDLRASLKSRDDRIDELEREVMKIEERLGECQRVIRELRKERDHETPIV